MASLRQKDSKISLKMDLKPEIVKSRIPIRINQKTSTTKPKIVPCVQPDSKRTSAIRKNKNSTAEVKRVKKSILSSQVMKDRNKIITKEIPQKLNPVQDKEGENQLCLFEKRIPEVNLLNDDPFKTSYEESPVKNSNHPSQQNIEFVADECMKKLILSNRELTPSILKSCSNRKTSMMERPSLYKKLNRIPVDPYKQVLIDIANYDLASEGKRISEMQKNSKFYLSPLQNRNSLYKPLKRAVDPYQEALRSIAELRMHQKIKSVKKKVTFNLSGDDQFSNSGAKDENHGEKPFSTIQPEFSKRKEKKAESNIFSSSKFEENMLMTSVNNPSKEVTFVSPSKTDSSKNITSNSSSKTDKASRDRQINKETVMNQTEMKPDLSISESTASSLKTAANNDIVHDLSPIFSKQKSDKYAAILNHDIKNSILKTTKNSFLNSMKASEFRQSLFSNQSELFLDKMNPKIFTPQPVSFYPRTNLFENVSPEFLSRRTTDILSCAPINTPLVLKSLGRHELSPVCKKLEFKDSPKENKKEAGDSRENSQTFHLQNIMTQQKILDQLAHQECSIFMHEAEFPCQIREKLQNPIAKILNDGDEMHFVPLTLWR